MACSTISPKLVIITIKPHIRKNLSRLLICLSVVLLSGWGLTVFVFEMAERKKVVISLLKDVGCEWDNPVQITDTSCREIINLMPIDFLFGHGPTIHRLVIGDDRRENIYVVIAFIIDPSNVNPVLNVGTAFLPKFPPHTFYRCFAFLNVAARANCTCLFANQALAYRSK